MFSVASIVGAAFIVFICFPYFLSRLALGFILADKRMEQFRGHKKNPGFWPGSFCFVLLDVDLFYS